MVTDWFALLIVVVFVSWFAWKAPSWLREIREHQNRWEKIAKADVKFWAEYERQREWTRWYRNIPARLDKWQQERKGA